MKTQTVVLSPTIPISAPTGLTDAGEGARRSLTEY